MYKAFSKTNKKTETKPSKCGQPTSSGPCIHSQSHENPCQSQETWDKLTKPVGRPTERPGAKKGGYKLDAEVSAKLSRLAKAKERSVHDLVSSIIEDWVDDQSEPADPSQLSIPLQPRVDVFTCPQCGWDKASQTEWHNCY